jgi:hypothetical protein
MPLHSLWSQVDVSIQQNVVSSTSTLYPYKAMIETLMDFGTEAKTTQLQCAGFFKDTAGHMNETSGLSINNRAS